MAASSPSKTTRRSVRSTVNILRPLRLSSLLFRSDNAVNAFPDLLGFFYLVAQFVVVGFNQFPFGGQVDNFRFPFRHGRHFLRVETPMQNIAQILFGIVVHGDFVAVGFVIIVGGGYPACLPFSKQTAPLAYADRWTRTRASALRVDPSAKSAAFFSAYLALRLPVYRFSYSFCLPLAL